MEDQLTQPALSEGVIKRRHAKSPFEQVQLSLGQLELGRRRSTRLAKPLHRKLDPVGQQLELEREVVSLMRVRRLDV